MNIAALLKQIRERFAVLSMMSRVALGAAATAVTLVFLLLSAEGSVATDGYLFTGLEAADAGEIVAKLKELRVPYTIAAGGAAIMVPEARVHELRLELAQGGLPKGGGVGFEILDRPSYGQSDFVQQKNYSRALAGELERTIAAMGSIQKARVHLVLPERRLFRDASERASASVVVRLRPGRTLGESQASGVIHLVASSVAGLTPDRVTLVDDSGNVLAGRDTGGAPTESLDYRRQLEKNLEAKVRGILDRALGVGQSSVQVGAELDFSQIDRTEESYDPERVVLRSEHAVDEKQNRATPTSMGVAGARANIVGSANGAAEAASQPTTSTSEKTTTTRNFEVNKVVSRTVLAPARLVRLNAAVLVDGIYEGEKRSFTPLPAEQLEALDALVKGALGYDAKRGDQLAIRCVPLHVEATDSPLGAPPLVEVIQAQAKQWSVPAASVLVVLLAAFAMGAALRGRQSNSPLPALLAGGPRTLREIEALTSEQGSPQASQEPKQVVIGDGSHAADVVRGWLSDSKEKVKEGGR